MVDREKVIKGLEELNVVFQSDVVLHPNDFVRKRDAEIVVDALALLKAQEPRVMTLEEVLLLGDNDFIFIEVRLAGNTKVKPAIYQPDNSSDDEGDGYCCISSSWGCSGFYHRKNYNRSWRCWTSRPDEKRRAETPWN